MLQSIPSDEVQALMETMRIRQNEDKVKALEAQRHREEAMRIWQEKEDEVLRKILIDAEATIRLEFENYNDVTIEGIKNTIKEYPNMHIIELCEMIMGKFNKNDLDKYEVIIYNKRKEIYDAFILQCRMEVNNEITSDNELLRLEELDKLRSNIDKANNALPSNKINGGVFEEDRLEIDYIISLDNPIPNMLDTRPSGLYFETRHLWESMNTSIQNRRNPRSKEIPVSWNNDYKDNKIPFLPQCPVCSNQNTILFESYGGQSGSPCYYSKAIDNVECVR